jgi:hypothetical protein
MRAAGRPRDPFGLCAFQRSTAAAFADRPAL